MSNYKSGKPIFILSIVLIVVVVLTPIFIIVAFFTSRFTIIDTFPPHATEFLNVEKMLKYCVEDGVYNGEGRYYLGGSTTQSERINDDGRLCSEILSLNLSETTEGIKTERIPNLSSLVRYYVPYDDLAYIVVYENDILGCEIHPDMISKSYYRYFDLDVGKAEELYRLAMEISTL